MPDDEHDHDAPEADDERGEPDAADLPPDSPARGVVDEESQHLPEPGEPG